MPLTSFNQSYCTFSAYGETGNDKYLDQSYPDPGGWQGQLMCGVYKPTHVISVSYGGQEVDLPLSYQRRHSKEYLSYLLVEIRVSAITPTLESKYFFSALC